MAAEKKHFLVSKYPVIRFQKYDAKNTQKQNSNPFC